jgi:hypothetical protein
MAALRGRGGCLDSSAVPGSSMGGQPLPQRRAVLRGARRRDGAEAMLGGMARRSRGRRRLLNSSSSSSGWPSSSLSPSRHRAAASLPASHLSGDVPSSSSRRQAGRERQVVRDGARVVGMVRRCGTHSATSGLWRSLGRRQVWGI